MPDKKVLLIDDDVDDRELFCEVVKRVAQHIHCKTVEGGKQALAMLNDREQEKPDLIFLDINMPTMDGWDCLSALKQGAASKEIPVIMYSTSSTAPEIEKAEMLGALSYFQKPFDLAEMKQRIKTVMTHLLQGDLASLPHYITS